MLLWKKNLEVPRLPQLHISPSLLYHCNLFFFIGDGDQKGSLGTKKWVGSKYMKTILFSILKSDSHIS